MLVAGNTSTGIFKTDIPAVLINVDSVPELHFATVCMYVYVCGGNNSLYFAKAYAYVRVCMYDYHIAVAFDHWLRLKMCVYVFAGVLATYERTLRQVLHYL